MKPPLSAVVVNYNAGAELRRCLESLVTGLAGWDWDAVVVDNASTDGSAETAASFDARVRPRRNEDNVGFARAANQGLAATAGPLALFINPDCRLQAGAVDRLWSELERHPRCAIAGPRVLDPDGRVQGSARGDPTLLTGLFGRATLLTRLFPGAALARRNVRTEEAIASGLPSVVVDWVSAACVLARRAALEAVGGFDERFFLYWEDADLCRRLRARRYEIRYVPAATVVHRVAQSSRTVRGLAIRAFHRSAYLYYTIHVAPRPWQPARWLAWIVLALRCRWQLLNLDPPARSP